MSDKYNPFLDVINPDNAIKLKKGNKEEGEHDSELAKRCMKHARHQMKMAEEEKEKGNHEMAKKHKERAMKMMEEAEMGSYKEMMDYEAEMGQKSEMSKELQARLDDITAKLEKFTENLNEVKLGISANNDKIKQELTDALKSTIDSYVKKD